jgi:hypothetical protein
MTRQILVTLVSFGITAVTIFTTTAVPGSGIIA